MPLPLVISARNNWPISEHRMERENGATKYKQGFHKWQLEGSTRRESNTHSYETWKNVNQEAYHEQ